ncbi:glycoside hydrolase superfamily [Aspergillus californicus]
MADRYLRVKGTEIVDGDDTAVILHGTSLGGWLNMENFMTGFPGHESGVRAAMRKTMGEDNYDFFFDRWLYYFFTEEDAKFLHSLGLNLLRLPFNHRHLEDDLNPRVLKEAGFKHLDRVVDLCAKYGIYTILDMHTVPGAQNQDWHSDNPTNYAAFWDYKDHQDRAVWLWEQIAARYKDNAWVAGYNPINEPADPSRSLLAPFYARIGKAIRIIDPHHILFLDGNTYAMEWEGFTDTIPNSVYAIHDYSIMGFAEGELYRGTKSQDSKLERQFLRKCEFHMQNKVPVWNGEFGPTFAFPDDPNEEEINRCRVAMLQKQLQIYDEQKIHWSTWPYKDIGLMGMVYTRQDSPWNQLIWPHVERKQRLHVDGCSIKMSGEVDALLEPLVAWIDEVSPNAKNTYPLNWDTKNHLVRTVFRTFVAQSLYGEFAELFSGKTKSELDELARSFALEECVLRDDLTKALREYAKGH